MNTYNHLLPSVGVRAVGWLGGRVSSLAQRPLRITRHPAAPGLVALLTDAKTAEDPAQQIVRRKQTGDFAQRLLGEA